LTRPRRHSLQPVRGLPSSVVRALARFANPPSGLTRLTAIAQIAVAAGTIALAVGTYYQSLQASRSAAAMERANRISVAAAQAQVAPRFVLADPSVDSGKLADDSATCWLKVRVLNMDNRPITVVSLSCDISAKDPSSMGLRGLQQGTSIAAGGTADFHRSVRVGLASDSATILVSWLHVSAAVRLEGLTQSAYMEHVYAVTSQNSGVGIQPFIAFQYTGTTKGLDTQLDPWCDEKLNWPWSNVASMKNGQSPKKDSTKAR
jgi:hypothetical protein